MRTLEREEAVRTSVHQLARTVGGPVRAGVELEVEEHGAQSG